MLVVQANSLQYPNNTATTHSTPPKAMRLVGGVLFLFLLFLEGLAVLVVGVLVEDAQVAGEA